MRTILCLLGGMLLVACGAGPRSDLDAAQQALDNARAAGAERLAAHALADAEAELTRARELDADNTQRAAAAAAARDAAELALTLTRAAHDEMLHTAHRQLAAAEEAAEQAAGLLDAMPRGVDTSADRARMEDDLDSLEEEIAAVEADLEVAAPDAPTRAARVAQEAKVVARAFEQAVAHQRRHDTF